MQNETWGSRIGAAFGELWEAVVAYSPVVLTGIAVVALGLGVAWLLKKLTVRLLRRLTARAAGRALEEELRESGVRSVAPEVAGRLVFWAVLLLSLASAGQILGLSVITAALNSLVRYLPSVLAAVLVVFGGLVLGNLTGAAVRGAASRARIRYADLLGQITRIVILLVAGVVALDQIGIESTLLILMISITVGTAIGGAALAFSLGARDAVRGFIAAQDLTRSYRVGDRVRIGDVDGRIIEFARTAVVLHTTLGRMRVPATEFAGQRSILLQEDRS